MRLDICSFLQLPRIYIMLTRKKIVFDKSTISDTPTLMPHLYALNKCF